MNIDQLSTQIVAINDAIQILARSETTVQQHTKEIDSILAKTSKNDERLREIESLIHQSCEMKSKEIQEQKESIHETLDKAMERSTTFTKYVAGAITAGGIIVATWIVNKVDTQQINHAEFEATQDAKADKIYNEIFTVMRDIKDDVSSMRSELAVLKTNQDHYQQTLHNHMEDEEKKWRGLK